MKIDARQIPPEGVELQESVDPAAWELDTDFIKFPQPLELEAVISKVTNVVTALIKVRGVMYLICGRCLNNFITDFKRDIRVDYPVDNVHLVVDFDPEIRDQLILDYPFKPLCREDCKGLCPGCGKDLNLGSCNCNNQG